jgi:hypothetical protein
METRRRFHSHRGSAWASKACPVWRHVGEEGLGQALHVDETDARGIEGLGDRRRRQQLTPLGMARIAKAKPQKLHFVITMRRDEDPTPNRAVRRPEKGLR